MGFYGNITNTSRTQFVFDKTYSSRTEMDSNVMSDGIYIGRYVLVQYDEEMGADWCSIAYLKNGEFYMSRDCSENSKFVYEQGNITAGKYIRVPGRFYNSDNELIIHNFDNEEEVKDILYRIVGEGNEKAIITEILTSTNSNYVANYKMDMEKYGEGRGYDSTVWQKVYTENHEQYVMIAELNTVVPTFDIAADAPTYTPIAPHFDADSTNVYYKIHTQPSWGLRVKSASANTTAKPIDSEGKELSGYDYINLSEGMENSLLSDEDITWHRSVYNPANKSIENYNYAASMNNGYVANGRWTKGEGTKIPAAIYYNKDGFDPTCVSENLDYEDKIAVEPTGKSGYLYKNHDGTLEAHPDTMEMSIILPSIGNTMSNIWDLVYGSAKVNNSYNRNLNVKWSEGSTIPNLSGLRLVTKQASGYGYEPEQVNTIAGAINSVHDLMGMIIQQKDDIKKIGPNALSTDYIYFDKATGKFYRKNKIYSLSPIRTEDIDWNNRYEVIDQPNTADWDLTNGHSNYYLDYIPSNPKDGSGDTYPNYILDRFNCYKDREYYKIIEPAESNAILGSDLLKGVFEPKTYYELGPSSKGGLSYAISLDKAYDHNKTYYKISYETLPDNARFFDRNNDDITYYKISGSSEVVNPTQNEFNKGIYFIKNNDRYERATEFVSSGVQYYTLSFEAETEGVQPNTQYFIASKVTQENSSYVEQTIYVVDREIVNEMTFSAAGPRYTYNGAGGYIRAYEYEEGQTYYYKQVTMFPVVSNTISGVVEIVLMEFQENPVGFKYCSHRPKGTDGANGYDEFIVLTNSNLSKFNTNLVKVRTEEVKSVYEPNTHYYKVEDIEDALYGSYVFDSEDKPKADRKYYVPSAVAVGDSVSSKNIYEPYTYYYLDANGNYILDKGKTAQPNTTYYKKNSLYVYKDEKGKYAKGTEWNLKVTDVPDTIQLAQMREVWGVEELKGFARQYNTIHGLILRLNDILEQKNEFIRDYDTVQGLMNKMKDILCTFGDMEPQALLGTDEMGQVTSLDISGGNHITVNRSGDTITVAHDTRLENPVVGYPIKPVETSNNGQELVLKSYELSYDTSGHVTGISEVEAGKVNITPPAAATIDFSFDLISRPSGTVMTSLNGQYTDEAKTNFAFTEGRENLANIPVVGLTKTGVYNEGLKENAPLKEVLEGTETAFEKVYDTFENYTASQKLYGYNSNLELEEDALALSEESIIHEAFAKTVGHINRAEEDIEVLKNKNCITLEDKIAYLPKNEEEWTGLASTNGAFVAISERSVIYSEDGFTWSDASSIDTSKGWESVIGGNGVFVISSSENGIRYSTDKGKTWKMGEITSKNEMGITPVTSEIKASKLGFGDGKFIAIQVAPGQNSTTATLYYSSNGIDWKEGRIHEVYGGYTTDICYDDGRFSFTTTAGGLYYVSASDLVSTDWVHHPCLDWVDRDSYYPFSKIIHKNLGKESIYVGLIDNKDAVGAYSLDDGETWTEITSLRDYSDSWSSLFYHEGKFVAINGNGDKKFTSEDGKNWELELFNRRGYGRLGIVVDSQVYSIQDIGVEVAELYQNYNSYKTRVPVDSVGEVTDVFKKLSNSHYTYTQFGTPTNDIWMGGEVIYKCVIALEDIVGSFDGSEYNEYTVLLRDELATANIISFQGFGLCSYLDGDLELGITRKFNAPLNYYMAPSGKHSVSLAFEQVSKSLENRLNIYTNMSISNAYVIIEYTKGNSDVSNEIKPI